MSWLRKARGARTGGRAFVSGGSLCERCLAEVNTAGASHTVGTSPTVDLSGVAALIYGAKEVELGSWVGVWVLRRSMPTQTGQS